MPDKMTWTSQKWGALAAFLVAASLIVAPGIYLVGNWRDALGRFGYMVADFLSGPVLAASLIMMVFTLRERMADEAPRRMSLALLSAALSAAAMLAVACLRASNRNFHLLHPELHLEDSSTVLIVWTTLVAGLTATGWHLFGWALLLIGSSGWTSGRLPSLLSVLYLLGGLTSLCVYLLPDLEGGAGLLMVILSLWQGLVLWRDKPEAAQGNTLMSKQPDNA